MAGINPSLPNTMTMPTVNTPPERPAAVNPEVASSVVELHQNRLEAGDVELKMGQVQGQIEQLRGMEKALGSSKMSAEDLDAIIRANLSMGNVSGALDAAGQRWNIL
ncbi:hypothetical protein [Hydrogenophaga sp. BPS33]|uniref:hypothetical protein n=1 Tax=Hydrogenophaga sp. BPS33 TaxID=2651974 RepID=UPI0013201112|nr:hypothetical protein [Hydrogenophaga sp. BPS33]QHE86780.1 hypothetical protein F9K07_18690 [Hydrogenophaga sp. BPS33]